MMITKLMKKMMILAFLPLFFLKPSPARANCGGQGQYEMCTHLIGQAAGGPDSVQEIDPETCRVSWNSPAYSLIQNIRPWWSCSIFWSENLGKFSMWTPTTGTTFYFAPINLPPGE